MFGVIISSELRMYITVTRTLNRTDGMLPVITEAAWSPLSQERRRETNGRL